MTGRLQWILDSHEVHVYSIPLTTQFRGLTMRDGMLLRGAQGWAEFSPFWDYSDSDCVPWFRAALEFADDILPTPIRQVIDVNATVPATSPERAAAIVLASGGCRTVKVKVAEQGQDLAEDIARVSAVRSALGSDGTIRLDANGGWTLDEALVAIPALMDAAQGLEYVEQPCRDIAELIQLRENPAVPVLIAADESIRRSADPLAVARRGAADLMVIKAQPLGGIRRSLAVVAQSGLPAVVSSALETSVGIRQGLWLAATLPRLDHACGLGTVNLLHGDVAREPLRPKDGVLRLTDLEIDHAALAEFRAEPATTARWMDRLARVCECDSRTNGEQIAGESPPARGATHRGDE